MAFFILLTLAYTAQAQDKPQTVVILRTGFSSQEGHARTYDFAEVYQAHGRWIPIDVGYFDSSKPGDYREGFVGGGATILNTKRVTMVEEGYLDVAGGSKSGGALYFQPWTLFIFRVTPKVNTEVVYFPYLPLNDAGRVQHVLERVKGEYDFGRVKIGGGLGGYKFDGQAWQNKPFVSTTLKSFGHGALEFWGQKMPKGGQLQVRYVGVF